MNPMVLLRHDTPDGGFHYDWMLARPGNPGVTSLVTFRTGERPDEGLRVGMTLERISDHRPAYLHYEGPLTGGRGSVIRIAAGRCAIHTLDETQMHADLSWDDALVMIRVTLAVAGYASNWAVRSLVTLTDSDRR